jgi:3-carboxy-cis,cis-muconate cycloisomerase
MSLLSPLLRWDDVEAVFAEQAGLQGMLDFEGALARAEAKAEVIPASAADAIGACCAAALFDTRALAREAALAGDLAIPMVRQLTALVREQDADAARFVHWGATSQDAIDTGLVLQLRAALEVIESELDRLSNVLASLADEHRATPICGRTWMQHAVPTTFGMKAAGWLDAILRHRESCARLRERTLAVQLGGTVGTLAALGLRGGAVASALAEELRLPLPDIAWHAQRDRMAEVATTCGLLVGTLGKIARDVALHGQTEIAELLEPFAEGRGGSSSMPHKQNPVASAVVLATATRAPGLVATLLSAMVQEDERGLGGWHAEWESLPELVSLSGGALHHLTDALAGLRVDTARMAANIEATRGLVYAEAVQLVLAERAGRPLAQRLLESACRRAHSEGRPLLELLTADPTVSRHVPPEELDRLFDIGRYVAAAGPPIDRVLARHARAKAAGGEAPAASSAPTEEAG